MCVDSGSSASLEYASRLVRSLKPVIPCLFAMLKVDTRTTQVRDRRAHPGPGGPCMKLPPYRITFPARTRHRTQSAVVQKAVIDLCASLNDTQPFVVTTKTTAGGKSALKLAALLAETAIFPCVHASAC